MQVSIVGGTFVGVGVLGTLARLLIASVRWLFRITGIRAVWRKVREGVFAIGKIVLWIAVAGYVLAVLWPYLSLDPQMIWYALKYQIPVERIDITKKPHDCEFGTAPLGSKNCHYEATPFVLKGDGPGVKKSLLVTYEKVED